MRKMQKLRVDAATHLHKALKDPQSYAETSEVYWHTLLPAPYLVWPIRCTLPIAWSSWAGLRIGSTSSTCVASMIFSPLEPVWRGRRRMLIFSSYLKELRFSWKTTMNSAIMNKLQSYLYQEMLRLFIYFKKKMRIPWKFILQFKYCVFSNSNNYLTCRFYPVSPLYYTKT